MARAAKQSGPGIFDDAEEWPEFDDEPEAEPGPVVKVKGRRLATLRCAVCGHDYQCHYLVSQGIPDRRCCARLFCIAVTDWTAEEWRLRAQSVRRRPPPPQPGTVVRVDPKTECEWCSKPLAVYVIPPQAAPPQYPGPLWMPPTTVVAGADRALACSGCGTVVRTFVAVPPSSHAVDMEALRRCPGTDDRPRFGLNVAPGLVYQPRVPVAAVRTPKPPDANVAPLVIPAPTRVEARARWEAWKAANPVSGAPANPATGIPPSPPPGWPSLPPPPEPLGRAASAAVGAPAAVSASPTSLTARANLAPAAASGQRVCQLVDRVGPELRAKCGREVTLSSGQALDAAGMTGFDSRVNCDACRAAQAADHV